MLLDRGRHSGYLREVTQESLYTLRGVAEELDLPESTVRYYRDAFSDFVPTVGTGRRRRYPAEAVAILRLVADGFAQNDTREQIAATLREKALEVVPQASAASPVDDPRPDLRVADPEQEPESPEQPPQSPATTPTALVPTGGAAEAAVWSSETDRIETLLIELLQGEQDRRETTSHLVREFFRLGEVVEKLHIKMTQVFEQVADQPNLLAGASSETDSGSATEVASSESREELEGLREALRGERELVDRLRKAKLDIERRAADAEARLEQSRGRKGLLNRLK